MAVYPNQNNTGVPEGVILLPSGGISINKSGAVVEGLNIRGPVYINADNVTLKNCQVTSTDFYVVKVSSGVKGAVVQDCDINGVGTGNDGSSGIAGQGTFQRNNIYNVENGITLQGSNSVIKDNYIHDLKASGSPHYDGIQIDGGVSNVVISHNTIINSHSQTAAVMIDNYFGPISNIKVDDNILVGGGYTVYSDGQFDGGSISGVSFTNNHIGGGYWGQRYFSGNSPVWQNNASDGVALADNLGEDQGNEGTPPSYPVPGPVIGHEVIGTAGDDNLVGSAADDHLVGGLGADVLTGGGGNDRFDFNSVEEMGKRAGERDIITDFTRGDNTIDLSSIDADGWQRSGNGTFHFIPGEDQVFDRKPGALAWHFEDRSGTSRDHTVVQGDINGDGWHDFEIQLSGLVQLSASDFIL